MPHVKWHSTLGDDDTRGEGAGVEGAAARRMNAFIRGAVQHAKAVLEAEFTPAQWNAAKRGTNPYEGIHMWCRNHAPDNVVTRPLVSRAYFKLWEILHDLVDSRLMSCPTPLHFVTLCESPGSFIAALSDFRRMRCCGAAGDSFMGISLPCSRGDAAPADVPAWRVPPAVLSRHRVRLHTGDLYSMPVVRSFVDGVLDAGSFADVVTADGGFDFSDDYDGQEMSMSRLIISEVYTALMVQRSGGVLVLKVFDLFDERMLSVLQAVSLQYRTVCIAKPRASRPANSERYMVFTGFEPTFRLFGLLDDLSALLAGWEGRGGGLRTLPTAHIPPLLTGFLSFVVRANAKTASQQVVNIMNTVRRSTAPPAQQPPTTDGHLRRFVIPYAVRYGLAPTKRCSHGMDKWAESSRYGHQVEVR